MTAVAPSPLPFTGNSHRNFQPSPRRHNGIAGSSGSGSMRTAFSGKGVNGNSKLGNSATGGGFEAYGDGIKALLADPIQFEPYAKKVRMDEAKYKPINAVETETEGAEGSAGSAKMSFSYGSTPSHDSATTSNNASPSTSKDLWPRPVKVTWPTEPVYERHAKGLQNLGNTCFANSILQVMMYTPPVLHYLSGQGHDSSSCVLSKVFCFTCELQKVKRNLWSASGQSWAPKEIMRSIKKICPTMKQFRQEDAHEFFRYGIDLLHNEALKIAKATETSWIHKVWGGRLRSRINCHECGNNSDTYDAFLDLSLDLDRSTESVKEALAKFVQKDQLSGKNKYKCEKCNKLVNATKQMQIVKAPEVLSLHLKRFTPTGRKITSTIRYTGNLNLQPYMDEQASSPAYELYAVTVHQGSGPHIGHYYSYVKNKNGKWFEANDESVSVAQARVFPAAYILHYIRKPGSALDAIKAGKVNGISVPGKALSAAQREEEKEEQGRPVAGPSSPIKRGEKRKQIEQAEEQTKRGAPSPSAESPDATSSGEEDEPEPEPVQKKMKPDAQSPGRKFSPVSSQAFGYRTSSVSEALKSKQHNGQPKGNKRQKKGKSHSSPYAAGFPSKRGKMQGRDFRRA
ncbi:hypothetical protein NCC49_002107 [Naganishia albida]|nr:hypothetical protein NCC49_002107 [Naganishia albida]